MINNRVDINALASYNNNSNILNKIKGSKIQNNQLSTSDDNKEVDAELMEACKTFETYFVEQVLKEMRLSIPKATESSDRYSYFEDLLYKEYATAITNQGELGLSQQLYESMKRNYNIND